MKHFLVACFLLFFIHAIAFAQLCNGNLGDPVVNVTFGTTHDPIPSTKTTFKYVGGCPTDTGQYTIQNLIYGCGENPNDPHSWHMLAGDHTGDENGQYMLVNASWFLGVSHAPAIIHLDTATALCGNTTYQYSAWLANVMRANACGNNPQLPDITFSVSSLAGAVLATTNTGALPIEDGRIWKQYGLSFTTPPNVDAVVLTLSITAQRGCGNGFTVDDITFSMCGPAVQATLDGSTEPANVCADYTNPFILKGSYATGFNDPVMQWQNSLDSGKTWTDISNAKTSTYVIPHRGIGTIVYRMAVAERANINNPHCRIVSNPIYTEVHPVPEHQAPQNLIGCINNNLHLPEADPSALNIKWQGPKNFNSTEAKSIIPNIGYADTGLYRLQQNFYFGCTSIDTFHLNVYPSTTISAQTLYAVCDGKTIRLSASGEGAFKWTPATGLSNDAIANPVATLHDSAAYKVVVTNSFGCKDSADVTVNVFQNPIADAGPSRTIVVGDTVLLNGFVKGTAVTYFWSPKTFISDPALMTPKVYPPENTEYTLTAISSVGCGTVTSSAFVKVYKDIYIPNAFTPNNDGINDAFRIYAADGYTLLKFQVYNRWGNVVFSAKDAADGWNGTTRNIPQPAGSYVYYLELKSAAGKTISKKGTLILLR